MIAKVNSCGLEGILGRMIIAEVDISGGLPAYDTVGLPDKAVTESRERVRAAIRNSKYAVPPSRITVNLAPADLRKEGTVYDLPIALGILACTGVLSHKALADCMFVGELALDGGIRPINGALPMAMTARENGVKCLVVPRANAREAAYVQDVKILGADTLRQLCDMLQGNAPLAYEPASVWKGEADERQDTDFAVIGGQYIAKRAAEVAAAGGHNMLLIGPPGGGKTLLARTLPTILPELTFEEAIEVTRIHSAAGRLQGTIINKRPFYAPHHSASLPAIVGGGSRVRPGEISLAHLGVLFLDELPEFKREALEALRQPLEDGVITVARAQMSATFPARFMLVAAMNPCPCGNYGSRVKSCTCPPARVAAYRQRLSGPLLDRIDIFVEMAEVSFADLHKKQQAESSAQVRERVNACREIQRRRFGGSGLYCNAHMGQREIERFCALEGEARAVYECEFSRRGLSGRANARVLRLARTIADLVGSENIGEEHVAEALQYRTLDAGYWS